MQPRLPDLLDDAVARGLITSAQRTQLLALAAAGDDQPRGLTGEFLAWTREVPRGFNAISIAYAIGALVVVFALGWFLADRWAALGPPGVLVVGVVYAGLFALAARLFTREHFATAHGLALLLLILVVPLVTWAALRTTGVWSGPGEQMCAADASLFWECRGRAMILAGTALAATLAAMRRLRFGPLMIPGAVSLLIIFTEGTLHVSRGGDGPSVPGWSFVIVASLLVTIAYEVDRRRGMEDYGLWLHLAAVVSAAAALIGLFDSDHALRPYLLPTALVMMAASLYLRRVVWLLLGLVALFASLLWLAREVFEEAVAFPVLLGFAGLAVILVTVLVQRQYPRLAERVRGRHGVGPHVPGGAGLLLLPALVAVFILPVARLEARWSVQWRAADERRFRIIAARAAPPALPVRRRGLGDDVPVRPVVPPDSAASDSAAHRDSLPVPPDTAQRADTVGVQVDSLGRRDL